MSREIKFRLYAGSERMIPWEEMRGLHIGAVFLADPPEHYHLMQSIGLCDPNGVEIYEGDVLANTSEHGDDDVENTIVEYAAPRFVRRYPNPNNWDGVVRDGLDASRIELLGLHVVGNIYENPELLEGR